MNKWKEGEMWAQEQLVDLWLVMVLPKTIEDAQDPFLS